MYAEEETKKEGGVSQFGERKVCEKEIRGKASANHRERKSKN
jgi:hypothetical protein